MLARAFDSQVDEMMMQDMMTEMLAPHFETEQITATLDNIDLMALLGEMEAETPEDMQEQLFDAVIEKIQEDGEVDQAGDEEEVVEDTFVFADPEEDIEAEDGQEGEEFETLPDIEEPEAEEEEMVAEEIETAAEVVTEQEEEALAGEEALEEEENVIEEATEENEDGEMNDVILPVKEEKEPEKGGSGLFWILTIIFAVSLGAGIYLNAFDSETLNGASKKGGREQEYDPEAISLTTYGGSNRNSRKGK